jgi:uncharacterized protein DUF6959
MTDQTVEILSDMVNMPVLRMPGRKFPGIVIQGDTLSSLFALSNMIRSRAEQGDDAEMIDLAEELKNELAHFLQQYEQVMKSHNMVLPYVSPFGQSQE